MNHRGPAIAGAHATGYLLSQGDLIRELLERRSRNEAVEGFVLGTYRTFQVAIKHIEDATGLLFPALRGADPLDGGFGGQEGIQEDRLAYLPLESIQDVVLDAAAPAGSDSEAGNNQALTIIETKVAALEGPNLLIRLVAIQDGLYDADRERSEDLARLFQTYQSLVGSSRSALEAPAPEFKDLKSEYQSLYDSCQIRPERKNEVAWYAKKLQGFQSRYEQVGSKLGIPWWFVGITHALEASFNFKGHLHNGDPLTSRTVQEPKGRPKKWNPPTDWESSAIDALTMKGYADQSDWSIPRALYRFEAYNGWGYRSRHVNTPYLWSFSNHYSKGKFVQDGKYDSSTVSKQCGAAVMLKALGVEALFT